MDVWYDNHIQFPRLLAEMISCGVPTDEQARQLCEEMDLTMGELSELLDRAQAEWERVKELTLSSGFNPELTAGEAVEEFARTPDEAEALLEAFVTSQGPLAVAKFRDFCRRVCPEVSESREANR